MTSPYKIVAARLVTRWWAWIIAGWLVLAVGLRTWAPSWSSVAQDGDLQFLPDDLPSRVGQRWLEKAFPNHRARSQIVVVLARREDPIQPSDLAIGLDLGRRLMHAAGVAHFRRWSHSKGKSPQSLMASFYPGEQSQDPGDPFDAPAAPVQSIYPNAPLEIQQALSAFDEAISLDQLWFDTLIAAFPDQPSLREDRLAIAYWDRAALHSEMGNEELAKADRDTAMLVSPGIATLPAMVRRNDFPWDGLLDVWTWQDPVLGSKLGDKNRHARLIVLQMQTEFIATSNIGLVNRMNSLIESGRLGVASVASPGLEIGLSGSAAVGGDMMRAAAASVKQTEWITVLMILGILAIVYRGPLLVAIPLATIGISLVVSTSLIALLANRPESPEPQHGLKVFTTTRIFVIVLLFGAGTDFCLFLIARIRELLSQQAHPNRNQSRRAVAISWISVHDALLGSALTTMVGLGLMYFSEFEKFKFTGPIIALSLAVTILVCLTFTPAVLCGLGQWAFWPASKRPVENGLVGRFWERVAEGVVDYPKTTLLGSLVFLGIPAIYGWTQQNWVTYDFARELNWDAPSRAGTRLLERYFTTRDASPITVIVARPTAIEDEKHWRAAIEDLKQKLYVPSVLAVRSLTDPLGDFPPDRRVGLFAQDAWRRRLLESHRSTQQLYVTSDPDYRHRVTRLDVLIEPDPFSTQAETILADVRSRLEAERSRTESHWHGSEFSYTGTTPGIADLKAITQADQVRIQWLVTLGVWVVLLVVLRKFWVSSYLILTVLLSYLTTLGLTLWFFHWAYGDDFVGLDWKVPLFLFVILVAVGQDYNVYLTTRVFEEQARHGPIKGLKLAMGRTGGIITSCGFVMAATFVAMTIHSPNMPVLRGIVELGFALALGVLIDTLFVRSVLVPAMFAWMTRRQSSSAQRS
jgi:RND superfamily putative drug exporter